MDTHSRHEKDSSGDCGGRDAHGPVHHHRQLQAASEPCCASVRAIARTFYLALPKIAAHMALVSARRSQPKTLRRWIDFSARHLYLGTFFFTAVVPVPRYCGT